MKTKLTRSQKRAWFDRKTIQSLKTDVGGAIAYGVLRRALRHVPQVRFERPVCIGIIVRDYDDLVIFKRAARALASTSSSEMFGLPKSIGVENFTKKQRGTATEHAEFMRNDRIFALATSEEFLPDGFLQVADEVIEVGLARPRIVFGSLRRCVEIRLSLEEALQVSDFPIHLIAKAARRGKTAEKVLKSLQAMAQHGQAETKSERPRSRTLDDLPGMGQAEVWGRQLAADLADFKAGRIAWADVDRGLLLSGPPGTGKTSFALALAATCDVPIITASLAGWQALGHMGDLLKAMKAAFAKAQEQAPCILFVDELDSFGDRERLVVTNSQHEDYVREVINGFLECLDGANGREGVVVIGATNHPNMIDAAIRRSGRLDRHIEIALPDAEARTAILRLHLGGGDGLEGLEAISARTAGMSGADLERLAREARRLARHESRGVLADDIVAHLPKRKPIPHNLRRRMAVHESGHVIVGLTLGRNIVSVDIATEIAEGVTEFRGGGTIYHEELGSLKTPDWIENVIATTLAGMAAEEIVYGDRSSGAGGAKGSDLDSATILAAGMHASFGFGDSLTFLSDWDEKRLREAVRFDPLLRRRVDDVLDEEYLRAKSILREKIDDLRKLSDLLVEKIAMAREEIDAALTRTHPAIVSSLPIVASTELVTG